MAKRQIYSDKEYLDAQFSEIRRDMKAVSDMVSDMNVQILGNGEKIGLTEKMRTLQNNFILSVYVFSIISAIFIVTHIQEAANQVVRFLEKRFF